MTYVSDNFLDLEFGVFRKLTMVFMLLLNLVQDRRHSSIKNNNLQLHKQCSNPNLLVQVSLANSSLAFEALLMAQG